MATYCEALKNLLQSFTALRSKHHAQTQKAAPLPMQLVVALSLFLFDVYAQEIRFFDWLSPSMKTPIFTMF